MIRENRFIMNIHDVMKVESESIGGKETIDFDWMKFLLFLTKRLRHRYHELNAIMLQIYTYITAVLRSRSKESIFCLYSKISLVAETMTLKGN